MELNFDARVGMFRGAAFSESTLKLDLQAKSDRTIWKWIEIWTSGKYIILR